MFSKDQLFFFHRYFYNVFIYHFAIVSCFLGRCVPASDAEMTRIGRFTMGPGETLITWAEMKIMRRIFNEINECSVRVLPKCDSFRNASRVCKRSYDIFSYLRLSYICFRGSSLLATTLWRVAYISICRRAFGRLVQTISNSQVCPICLKVNFLVSHFSTHLVPT